MDRQNLRIISKVGLVMVIVGFFMPVSCNLNGFQIAEYASSFGGVNPLSIGLYGVFAFSCFGSILLLLIVMKKSFSIAWDWFVILGTFGCAIVAFIKMDVGNTGYGNMFQSGAYIMLAGLVIALIFILMATTKKADENKQEEKTSEKV